MNLQQKNTFNDNNKRERGWKDDDYGNDNNNYYFQNNPNPQVIHGQNVRNNFGYNPYEYYNVEVVPYSGYEEINQDQMMTMMIPNTNNMVPTIPNGNDFRTQNIIGGNLVNSSELSRPPSPRSPIQMVNPEMIRPPSPRSPLQMVNQDLIRPTSPRSPIQMVNPNEIIRPPSPRSPLQMVNQSNMVHPSSPIQLTSMVDNQRNMMTPLSPRMVNDMGNINQPLHDNSHMISHKDLLLPSSPLRSLNQNDMRGLMTQGMRGVMQPESVFKSSITMVQNPHFDRSMDNGIINNWSKRNHFHTIDKTIFEQFDTIENVLKNIRTKLSERNLPGLDTEITNGKRLIEKLLNDFDELISNQFLSPSDFENVENKRDKLLSNYMPKVNVYEIDYQTALNPEKSVELPYSFSIVSQDNAGPIFKEKLIPPITLLLVTGTSIRSIQQISPVQPILVEPPKQRIKRVNQEIENSKQMLKEDGTVVFNDLKFSSGTFPHLVPLKFKTEIEFNLGNNQKVKKTLECNPSKPYISMTNTGSQWMEAAGSWLKEECFKDNYEVTIQRFWNYFQKHFLVATKQEINNIKRPLYQNDFDYIIYSRFQDKKTISQQEYKTLWDWIGPGLKKIRYQKHLQFLFVNGYLPAFVSNKEAEDLLRNEKVGSFVVRLSSSMSGEFAISYVSGVGKVRHYMVQPDDTADKKKTLVDFIGNQQMFKNIFQMKLDLESGQRLWEKFPKDKVLKHLYKKRKSLPKGVNGYDTCIIDFVDDSNM